MRDGEPHWLPEDTQAALEWDAWRRSKCSGCGQPLAECMGDGPDAVEYEPEIVTCFACKARDEARRSWAEGDNDTAGVKFGVRPAEEG